MASTASDAASSDIPDGLELELLVEITTEVDSQLPFSESDWVELLMNTYDAKVRLLPSNVSTSRLFHWIRKIAQLRQPGQGTWACFRAICEESDIELGFEPSFVDLPEPLPAPTLNQYADKEPKASREASGTVPPSAAVKYKSTDALDVRESAAYISQRRPTLGGRLGGVDKIADQDAQRHYPLTHEEVKLLEKLQPGHVDEVATAKRHLLRKQALVAWRDYTIDSRSLDTRDSRYDDNHERAPVMQTDLIGNAQIIALQHVQTSQRRSDNMQGSTLLPMRSKIRGNIGQLEDITEEATMKTSIAPLPTVPVSAASRQHVDNQLPSQFTHEATEGEIGLLATENSDDREIPNAQELLRQARCLKADLYFELWRHKTHQQAKNAATQLQETRQMKAEMYFELCRRRTNRKKGQEEILMQQVQQMKANLAFDQWNRHTRLFAVLEDNDRMYAEQILLKLQSRQHRSIKLQHLVESHKYDWACEHVWNILLDRKQRLIALDGKIELVQYYRNAVEPFIAWRSNTKVRQNERLALAYKEARRCHKMSTVSKQLHAWQEKIQEQKAILARAQNEVDNLRTYSAIELIQNHAAKLQRLNMLVPIAREQIALLYVDSYVGKWRDRARQWRAMKRIAEEMQQERRERIALEAFRKWRSLTPVVLESRNIPSSDSALSDTDNDLPEPETPKPMSQWRSRLTELPATPRTAPAVKFKNVHEAMNTPRTAPGRPRFTNAIATPSTAIHTRAFDAISISAIEQPAQAPRTLPTIRQLRDPAAMSFRTPRRVRGPLFTDPVFFERLKQVMPEHALLNGAAPRS